MYAGPAGRLPRDLYINAIIFGMTTVAAPISNLIFLYHESGMHFSRNCRVIILGSSQRVQVKVCELARTFDYK